MRVGFTLIVALLCSVNGVAQSPSFFDQVKTAILDRNEQAFLALALPEPEVQQREKQFIRSVFSFPYQVALVRLAEEKPDRLILHVFLQAADEARFESWVLYTQKDEQNRPRIRISNTINAISGLYRLKMSDRPYTVRNLNYTHVDATIHFQQGSLFPIEAGGRIAGVFFLGNATFKFAPKDPTERQQLTLFGKKPTLETKMTRLFIRSSPERLEQLLQPLAQQTRAPNANLYQRAQKDAADFDRNVYSVRVPFSDELWFAQMEASELYCEMKTDVGTLLYQHSPSEEDDILLVRKEKEQIISLYDSGTGTEKDNSINDFKILSYKMKLRFQPIETHLSGVIEIQLEGGKDTNSIIFRLNPELRVSQIKSSQGYLIYFQERKTSNLHLVLNETLRKGDSIGLEFFYQGKITPEMRSHETTIIQAGMDNDFYMPPTYLYSNQSFWYPQLKTPIYSGFEASITVPDNYAVVTNGTRTGIDSNEGSITYSFECRLPAKYFSLFVGRLDSYSRFESIVPIDVYSLSLDKTAAQEYAAAADRILRFYSGYFGTYPYQNFALVLRPIHQPGGHAPASIAIVNRVFKFFQRKFAKDPLYIPEFPHFLLAHEIAHQWWGQTVGWETYRDQWLSEGFAQFAAWEYMRNQYGDEVWKKLGDIFQEWIEQKSYAGPLVLGARLGHITDDPQAYTALLYNKGAFTLNMLKHWMGAENFSRCLSEFYEAYQFRRTGVEEFKLIAQKYSEEDLDPFFRQWIYGWEIPEVAWTIRVDRSQLKINFQQKQNRTYQLRIPVIARSKNGEAFRFTASIQEREEEVTIDLPFIPDSTEIDPLHETLMKTSGKR
jgi:aminopeptidase N